MSLSATINIVPDENTTSLEKYDARLRALILTPEGSMVGNRGFGIDYDLIDLPPEQAANYLQMELERKLPEYIPGIVSRGVEWTSDIDGNTTVTITVGMAEEEEEND